MQQLMYLSRENRERIKQLREQLNYVTNETETSELLNEISEIETLLKPLKECTVTEALDLKGQIWETYTFVSKRGKTHLGRPLEIWLRQIDTHINNLKIKDMVETAERVKEAKERRKLAIKSSKGDRQALMNDNKSSKSDVSSGNVSHQWSVDLSDLD